MKKRILSPLLALTMCLSLLSTAAFADESGGTPETTGVDYLYYDESTGEMATGTKTDGEYTTVENSYSAITWGNTTNDTWYVVPKDTTVTINGTVTLGGNVHLILCDGATLTINGGRRMHRKITASKAVTMVTIIT